MTSPAFNYSLQPGSCTTLSEWQCSRFPRGFGHSCRQNHLLDFVGDWADLKPLALRLKHSVLSLGLCRVDWHYSGASSTSQYSLLKQLASAMSCSSYGYPSQKETSLMDY